MMPEDVHRALNASTVGSLHHALHTLLSVIVLRPGTSRIEVIANTTIFQAISPFGKLNHISPLRCVRCRKAIAEKVIDSPNSSLPWNKIVQYHGHFLSS